MGANGFYLSELPFVGLKEGKGKKMSEVTLYNNLRSLQRAQVNLTETYVAAKKDLGAQIAEAQRRVSLSQASLDLDKITLAETVLEIRGSVANNNEGCLQAAMDCIAERGGKIKTQYFGVKQYSGFGNQREDHSYNGSVLIWICACLFVFGLWYFYSLGTTAQVWENSAIVCAANRERVGQVPIVFILHPTIEDKQRFAANNGLELIFGQVESVLWDYSCGFVLFQLGRVSIRDEIITKRPLEGARTNCNGKRNSQVISFFPAIAESYSYEGNPTSLKVSDKLTANNIDLRLLFGFIDLPGNSRAVLSGSSRLLGSVYSPLILFSHLFRDVGLCLGSPSSRFNDVVVIKQRGTDTKNEEGRNPPTKSDPSVPETAVLPVGDCNRGENADNSKQEHGKEDAHPVSLSLSGMVAAGACFMALSLVICLFLAAMISNPFLHSRKCNTKTLDRD